MPLITTKEQMGDGLITNYTVNTRKYNVTDGNNKLEYYEVTKNETRIWVGIEFNLALSIINANEQPVNISDTYSWSMQEDSRQIKSFIVQRDFSSINNVLSSEYVVSLNAPTYSVTGASSFPAGTPRVTFPLTFTVQSSLPGSKLYGSVQYRNAWTQGIWDGPIDYLTGSFPPKFRDYNSSSQSFTINPPPVNTSINANKAAVCLFYATYTTQTGLKLTSTESVAYYINQI